MYCSKIKSIKKIGEAETFDLHTPKYENFLLDNGILSHNSGKTNSAIVCAYYLKSLLNRDIHLFFKTEKATDFAKMEHGKIIIIDEPSLDSLSKDQATTVNKNFIRLLNTMRQKRHVVIACITRFWRFPFDLVVDRSLAMINMTNSDGRKPGRFLYIRQKKLELLWDMKQTKHKLWFGKLKSFGGAMPERMETPDENGVPYFNRMGIIINGKKNCTYDDYKFFRDVEVGDIGAGQEVKLQDRRARELNEFKYKVLCFYKYLNQKYGIQQLEFAQAFGVSVSAFQKWAMLNEKNPSFQAISDGRSQFSLVKPHFESLAETTIDTSMGQVQEKNYLLPPVGGRVKNNNNNLINNQPAAEKPNPESQNKLSAKEEAKQ
jgi:hypothetical protein